MHGTRQESREHGQGPAGQTRGSSGEAALPGDTAEASNRNEPVAEEPPAASCTRDAAPAEYLDNASTCASEDDERLADLEDSDAELEDDVRPRTSVAAGWIVALASKVKWADIVDTDDELELSARARAPAPAPAVVAVSAKQKWADFSDSDEEEHSEAVQKPVAVVVSAPPQQPLHVLWQARSTAPTSGSSSSAAARPAAPTAAPKPAAAAHGAGRMGRKPQAADVPKEKRRLVQVAPETAQIPGWAAAQAWAAKPQCQFTIGIEEEPTFKVKSRLIGQHGQHMKSIAHATGAKLRLRGRGSSFLEGEEQRESTDDLMLCVSAPDWGSYVEAQRLVGQLLTSVYKQHREFTRRKGLHTQELQIQVHEGPRPGSR